MKSSLLYPLSLLLLAPAHAQVLPAPATPKPAAPAPEPLIIENPLSTEAPIVIGEPVRHQNGMTSGGVAPKSTVPSGPARKSAAKSRASVAGVSISGLSDGASVAKLRAALAPQLKEPLR
ncbi:MAG TPA: hypothetical protein VF627_08620, partial [Abditibacterium sp.]